MSDPQVTPRVNDPFPTTHWTRVIRAVDPREPDAHAALAELCAAYWYPLYAFVRRKGYDVEDARDMVQGFLARLLEKNGLTRVDPSKGKFRSFLMAACSNYLANCRDHERARKRGGGRICIQLGLLEAEARYRLEPSHELTAERLCARQWALTLLDRVLDGLEAEMTRAGKAGLFLALRPTLLGAAERVCYARVAAPLGISEGTARTAAHRLRTRYRELLRREVASTVDDDPGWIDKEIADLLAALAV